MTRLYSSKACVLRLGFKVKAKVRGSGLVVMVKVWLGQNVILVKVLIKTVNIKKSVWANIHTYMYICSFIAIYTVYMHATREGKKQGE